MKKQIIPLLAAAMLLTACGKTADNSTPETSAPETTTAAQTTTTPAETTQSASAAPETTTVRTTAATSTEPIVDAVEIPPAVYTTAAPAEPRSTGGEGGEEHGADPQPAYFNYLFLPDSVSMRLSGGNYQTISYDFAQALEAGTDDFYYLDDFDFDGDLELAVQTARVGEDITCVVFCWHADTAKYSEAPDYVLVNPVVHNDTKTVTELRHSGDSQMTLTVYQADGQKLTVSQQYIADFNALTLTDSTGAVLEKPENSDLLANALLAYR